MVGGDATAKAGAHDHAADNPRLIDPIDRAQVEDDVGEDVVLATRGRAGGPMLVQIAVEQGPRLAQGLLVGTGEIDVDIDGPAAL